MVEKPMPMRPCRGTPESRLTQIGTSWASRLESNWARIATLAARELVRATPFEAATTSANRVNAARLSK